MLNGTLSTLLTIFGVGFLIFVHELGHYLAARAVGIRVEAFSIGFGKRIWGFTRGPTEYKLCLVPLGGYVKMAGEDPTNPTTGQPDEFGSKTVWQRTLVISAGVIMNFVTALVIFAVSFAVGVDFEAPWIGSVQPGGPAWKAGLLAGDEVLEINGRRVLSFEDINHDAAVADGHVTLLVKRGGETRMITVTPEDIGDRGFQQLGVSPAWDRVSVAERVFDAEAEGNFAPTARLVREAGFAQDDRVLSLGGIENPDFWPALLARGEAVEARVRRGGETLTLTLPPLPEVEIEDGPWMIGVAWSDQRVRDVREGSPAERLGLREGDRILEINGIDVTGPPIETGHVPRAVGAGVEPYRVGVRGPDEPYEQPLLTMRVRRKDGSEARLELLLPTPRHRLELLHGFHTAATDLTVHPMEGMAAIEAGVLPGDLLVAIDGQPVDDVAEVGEKVQEAAGKPLRLTMRRGGEEVVVAVTPRRQRGPMSPFVRELALKKVEVPLSESFSLGWAYSIRSIHRIFRTLKSLLTGGISPKHLAGVIGIVNVAYRYSTHVGLMRMLLFLAVISINLAIINVLPIPALDGGWLMFLIIEKIKGSPISDRTMGWFHWAGFVFVVGLMVFVTWNDIARLVGIQ